MNAAVTDKELDMFWGTEPTQAERELVYQRHSDAFDADELDVVECASEHGMEIIQCLKAGDLAGIGRVFALYKAQTVSRRVDIALYGRVFPDTLINCRVEIKTQHGTVSHFGKFADTCSAAIAAQAMMWPTPCSINVVAI
jgi:hypothetical protein